MSSGSSDELAGLDGTAQAELVRTGAVTPLELVEAAIDRIERLNPRLNAVIHRAFEEGRARAVSDDLPDGPFRGVPILMKDIGSPEAGRPNHCGMRFLKEAHWTEKEDSYFTQRMKGAGTVSLGRTNTPELAIVATTEPEAYGPTLNPWNTALSAGGSSGGAAAAVASGMVPFAHASDGGGSIRGPAGHNGLFGLKPTRARNSFGPGVGERWSSLSSEFVVSRSVRDSAALLDITSAPVLGDPYVAPAPSAPFAASVERDPGKLRIGLMRRPGRDMPIDPTCVQAAESMAATLSELGHVVEEAHPEALDDASHILHYVTIVAVNTARSLDSFGAKVGREVTEADVEPTTWALASQAHQVTAPKWLETIEYIHGFGRRMHAFWAQGFDLLLTPTFAALQPKIGHLTSTRQEPLRGYLRSAPYGVFTLPFNMTGQPAVNLPTLWTDGGLPVGTQLVAAYGCEELLLSVSAQVERAAPWAERRPPIFG